MYYFFKNKTFLSFILCFSIFISVSGQATLPQSYHITVDTAAYIQLPDFDWQMMPDPSGKMTLQQAIQSLNFQDTDTDRKVNYKINTYWQRFRLVNNMKKEARISLPEVAASVSLYSKTDSGKWEFMKTGTDVPWSRRDGLKQVPAFTLSIPPGQSVTFYRRVYWNFVVAQPDSMAVYAAFTDKLVQQDYVNDDAYLMTGIQNAFLMGMVVLSIVINFYFFLVVREKEFLWFCIFGLFFCMVSLSSLNDVFLREYPGFLLYLYFFSRSIIGFALIHFVRTFLKTSIRFPRWDKFLVLFSYVLVAGLLSAFFITAILRINLASVSHFTENLLNLLYGLAILITLLLYVRNNDKAKRLLSFALLPVMCLNILTYTAAIINHLYYPRFGSPDVSGYTSPFNKAAFFILILCYLWMMILFTWVLFLRFSGVRKKLAEQSSLDHLKSRFFANISHEFRTPLTLIIGPIEDLLEDKNTYKFREQLKYIHRNSKRLLQLINQLLDLSRLDVGNYQVDTTREDLIPFVKQIVHSFSSMAQRKNILLETEVAPHLKNDLRNETSIFYFDEDIFEKILYNLLSNAFKFTPDGGSITVSISRAEKDLLELKVEDTGMGIPSEKLPYIFDRFYQADNSHKKQYEGTGIGLALVKELVELHHGKITVESTLGSGTIFRCYFPFNKKRLSPKNETKITANQNVIASVEEEKSVNEERGHVAGQPKALVVEDQQDVRKYISGKLAENYTVIEAKNGREGFDIAKDQMPDIVISDVMMPETDGFELCKLLKTNDLTSHIPVILLTARAEDIDKLTGLETGADAYLIKPFNSKELLVRIHNLINLRNNLRKKFSNKLIVKPNEITVTPQDSRFMHRLLDTVEKHISDEKFSVEQLAGEFSMSPSQINRKLKAIINQSTAAFIRSVRMERAMELLKNNQATIAEVAYETGFTEPAYFSRVFKNYFGYPPSEIKR